MLPPDPPEVDEQDVFSVIRRISREAEEIAPGVRPLKLTLETAAETTTPAEASPEVGVGVEAEDAEPDQEGGETGEPVPRTPVQENGEQTEATTVPAPPPARERQRSFAQVLTLTRQNHPLPREMQLDPQSASYSWLMSQLQQTDTPERLQELAARLNYRHLALLFPTLATLSKRGQTEQISALIRFRASLYLYYQGWTTLQFAFPRPTVAKALSDLCIQLEDRLYAFGSQMPALLGRRSRPELGPDAFVWSDIPLISEISLPNGRHFLSDLARAALDSEESLEHFFSHYAIYSDLPFGQALLQRIRELEAGTVLENSSPGKSFFERYRR